MDSASVDGYARCYPTWWIKAEFYATLGFTHPFDQPDLGHVLGGIGGE